MIGPLNDSLKTKAAGGVALLGATASALVVVVITGDDMPRRPRLPFRALSILCMPGVRRGHAVAAQLDSNSRRDVHSHAA